MRFLENRSLWSRLGIGLQHILSARKVFQLAAVFCCVLPAQSKPPQLPVAQGREVVLKICAMCHEIGTVIASRRTRIGWERTVDDMIGRGAEGSDAEMDAVVEYLTAYFGKVNVNTASAEELKKAVGLSTPEAEAIVAYRERNGNFKAFEELKKVPRLRTETLDAKRGLIAFSL
jgi:competence protein ComEA